MVLERLRDPHHLAQHHSFVFVGEISRMETIHHHRCRAGVEEKLEYRISELLWNDPDSYARSGGNVGKGFIDCTQKRLPPPFEAGSKVIVYCEAEPARGDRCLPPVHFADDRLQKVRAWIDELKQKEGDPVLLQIHDHLRDSLELAPSRPILFLGQVSWAEPINRGPRICTICELPTVRVAVNRLLWGYDAKEREIAFSCRGCADFSLGMKVIAYCGSPWPNYTGPERMCSLATSAYTDENVHRAERWAAQARQNQQAVILSKIRKSLDGHHWDDGFQPKVYRGHVESFGKAENGVPVARFVDTSGKESTPPVITLYFHFPYPPPGPLALEVGKPMITFCYQKDDVCYIGEEALGIIEDSDEAFQAIRDAVDTVH